MIELYALDATINLDLTANCKTFDAIYMRSSRKVPAISNKVTKLIYLINFSFVFNFDEQI